MKATDSRYLYRSPFNFLDPYTKNDRHIFFGRDDEIDEVFMLFEKTNMVVIYGPSGSGKSSVAQCGLVNRFFDWKPIEIRRNSNIIDSFFDAIELKSNADNKDDIGLFPKEDCTKLRSIFDKLIISTKEENYDPNTNEDLVELRAIIEKLYMNLSITPFYIFDQFEELFIENRDTAEIEDFSLLLSLITKRITYANVVICIQTEFFSNLVKLESHNPNILNYKCEIKDPNEKNIRKIIRGTFEKFNINQLTDDTGNEITKEEKNIRIDEIIIRLKKVGSHLPFVQIYLDKLYVLDFENTYPKDKELLKNPKSIITDDYPLEFKVDEIEAYGQIEEILENYIDEVNTAVIAENNQIGHKGHEHSVVKFLKFFITENNTRRGIKVEQHQSEKWPDRNYYCVQGELKNDIIRSLWGKNRTDVDESIGDIIDELLNARILKYRNGVLEFSHNFLVKVVKKIAVDENIIEYYKRQFNSAFDTYLISNESYKELLSSGQVKSLKGNIKEILGTTEGTANQESKGDIDEKLEKKEEFWKRSKRKMYLWRIVIYASYIVPIVLVTNGIQRFKTLQFIEQAEKEEKISKHNKTVNDATDFMLNDVTQSFIKLKDLPAAIKNDSLMLKDFNIGLKMRHGLIQDYVFNPFYKKKIQLSKGKRAKILSTKSRFLNEREFILFVQTPDKLFSTMVRLDNQDHSGVWNEISHNEDPITAYEPYRNIDNKIRLLYSNGTGIHDSDWELKSSDKLLVSNNNDIKKLKDIDYCGDNIFVGLSEDSKKIWRITKSSSSNIYPISIPDRLEDDINILSVKTLDKDKNVIAYVYKNTDSTARIYKQSLNRSFSSADQVIRINDPSMSNTLLSSFKLDPKNELILFRDKRKVFSVPFTAFKVVSDTSEMKSMVSTKILSFHQAKVESMDSSDNLTFLGSEDKSATLYYDPNPLNEDDDVLVKQLKGHTDAIKNVSFLGSEHALTSSEDGTIALWDISGPEDISITRREARTAIRLKYDHGDKFLYAGFQKNINEESYLLQLKENDNGSDFNAKNLMSNINFDSNSFGFHDENIFVGYRFRNIIEVYNIDQEKIDEGSIACERIFDLEMEGRKMALATDAGIHYFPDCTNLSSSRVASKSKGIKFNTIDFHPNSEWVVATSDNKNLYYWDIPNDEFKAIENAHVDKVKDARFSPDGNYLISGSWDNTAILWKVKEGPVFEQFTEISSHNSDITAVAAAKTKNNELILATASSDKTVQLHRLNLNDANAELDRVPSIIRHDYAIRSVTFGENADILYSADSHGTIKKWTISTFLQTIEDRTAKIKE